MKAKTLLVLSLLTGCMNHNHYPERPPYVKRELALPDFSGLTEDEKRAMGFFEPRKELAPKGAPFDLSRYDGSYDDLGRCIIDLTTSSESNKDLDICYETVPSPELREKFKFYHNNPTVPTEVRIIND